MDNLDQYFSDAEENISNEYMSANGVNEWDDAFDFGGTIDSPYGDRSECFLVKNNVKYCMSSRRTAM